MPERKAQSKAEFPPPQRGWRLGPLVLGPGLLLALAVVLALRFSGRLAAPPRNPFERPTVADAKPLVAPRSEVGLVPEPGWLVRRGAEIPLTAEQTARAKALAAQWDRETAAARQAIDQASAQYGRYLAEQRRAGRFSQADAVRQAETYSGMSAELAQRRHAYWDRVWATLTAAQRERVKQLRAQAPVELR